jgi:hypothetical protein
MSYVKEEFSDDYLHPSTRKANTSTQASMEGATCVVREEFLKELVHTAPGAYLQDNTSEADAGVVAEEDGATCTMQKNFPILVLPPLNEILEFDPTPPSLLNPE